MGNKLRKLKEQVVGGGEETADAPAQKQEEVTANAKPATESAVDTPPADGGGAEGQEQEVGTLPGHVSIWKQSFHICI